MRIKIDNVVYDSSKQIIVIELSDRDKIEINAMNPAHDKLLLTPVDATLTTEQTVKEFCFPDGDDEDEVRKD